MLRKLFAHSSEGELSKGGQRLRLAYEARPLDYNLYRLSKGLGHRCDMR